MLFQVLFMDKHTCLFFLWEQKVLYCRQSAQFNVIECSLKSNQSSRLCLRCLCVKLVSRERLCQAAVEQLTVLPACQGRPDD